MTELDRLQAHASGALFCLGARRVRYAGAMSRGTGLGFVAFLGLAGCTETAPDAFVPAVVELPSFGPRTRIWAVDEDSRRALLLDGEDTLFEVNLATGRMLELSSALSIYRDSERFSFPLDVRFGADGEILFVEGPDLDPADYVDPEAPWPRLSMTFVVRSPDGRESRVPFALREPPGRGSIRVAVTYFLDGRRPTQVLFRDGLEVRLLDLSSRQLSSLQVSEPDQGVFVDGGDLREADVGWWAPFDLPRVEFGPRLFSLFWVTPAETREISYDSSSEEVVFSTETLCVFENDRIRHMDVKTGVISTSSTLDKERLGYRMDGRWCLVVQRNGDGFELAAFDGLNLRTHFVPRYQRHFRPRLGEMFGGVPTLLSHARAESRGLQVVLDGRLAPDDVFEATFDPLDSYRLPEAALIYGREPDPEDGRRALLRFEASGVERLWEASSEWEECPVATSIVDVNLVAPADPIPKPSVFGTNLTSQVFNGKGQMLHCTADAEQEDRWRLTLIDGPTGETRGLHEESLPFMDAKFGNDFTLVLVQTENDDLRLRVLEH